MLRYLFVITALSILTACSELKVVGNAALRELRADGINVEQISYRYNQKLAALEKRGNGLFMAKREIVVDGKVWPTAEKVKKPGVAKAKKVVKGLWKTH